MGFTRHGLLTPTYAAADEVLAAAPAALRHSAFAAVASPAFADSTSGLISSRTSRALHAGITTVRAAHDPIIASGSRSSTLGECARDITYGAISHLAWSFRSLLLPCAGRHALDELTHVGNRGQACRTVRDRAVKNLRFVASAVLLLNFREVSDFHFCSISVAM